MVMLNKISIGTLIPDAWMVALTTNVTLNVGSVSFYVLEKAFNEGALPPEVYYYWNWGNYLNAQYGSKVVGVWFLIQSIVKDGKTTFDYLRLLAYGFQ